MKSDAAIGWYLILFGVVACSPFFGRVLAWMRDLQFRVMPFLRKLPGVGFYYNDSLQTRLRITVGAIFILTGLLSVLGVVDLND
jgi:hypothetical protein